jgi:hypothetical protein
MFWGRAVIIPTYAVFPIFADAMRVSNTARSFSESPGGAGPPTGITAATSGGTTAGRLR